MSQNQAMNAQYFRKQAKYWFIFAVVALVAFLVLWLTSGSSKEANQEKQAEEQTVTALPTRITQLVDLQKEVRPIDFSTIVRDLRSYPMEFKDKFYYENIHNRFAVELMDVVENEVIANYLDSRSDRSDFTYFRYLDSDKKPHYVLTYGKFQTEQEAQQSIGTTNFGLPESIKPKVVKVSEFLKIIDNYMRAEGVADLAVTQPRRIMLQATGKEIPVQAATRADADLVRRSQVQQERIRKEAQEAAKRRQEAQEAARLNSQAFENKPAESAPQGERSTPLTQNHAPQATPDKAPTAQPAPAAQPTAPTAQPTTAAEKVEPKADNAGAQ